MRHSLRPSLAYPSFGSGNTAARCLLSPLTASTTVRSPRCTPGHISWRFSSFIVMVVIPTHWHNYVGTIQDHLLSDPASDCLIKNQAILNVSFKAIGSYQLVQSQRVVF